MAVNAYFKSADAEKPKRVGLILNLMIMESYLKKHRFPGEDGDGVGGDDNGDDGKKH